MTTAEGQGIPQSNETPYRANEIFAEIINGIESPMSQEDMFKKAKEMCPDGTFPIIEGQDLQETLDIMVDRGMLRFVNGNYLPSEG